MKLNETAIKLMFDLSNIDDGCHSVNLDVEGDALRSNLLHLFGRSQNPTIHDIIINIMSEAGYPWFGKIAHSVEYSELPLKTDCEAYKGDQLMSNDDFMDLLPINGFFH